MSLLCVTIFNHEGVFLVSVLFYITLTLSFCAIYGDIYARSYILYCVDFEALFKPYLDKFYTLSVFVTSMAGRYCHNRNDFW